MKRFVMLPGLSSPGHPNYKPVYGPLSEEAAGRGWEPQVVYYPGQIDENGVVSGSMSPDLAVERTLEILRGLEGDGIGYRVLGISTGCFVALASVLEMSNTTGLDKVVLWGPIPFWYNWTAFGCGKKDENLGRGTTFVDPPTYYQQAKPLEHLITQVKVPVHVCCGTKDKYVPPEFIAYLRRLCQDAGRQNVSFAVVDGCSHSVAKREGENWQGYLEVVFS